MHIRRVSVGRICRFSALTGLLAGIVVAMAGLASAAESYTFAGLRWGSSPAEVRKALKAQGFKVRRTVKGAVFLSDFADLVAASARGLDG